ncbi:hypothetical protein C1645_841696 [Glomus cerebriforme]|uniref:Uncharacterized protein n=1 Tax=Glomus cerebriforme TaxID=658196 RepID=A0A397S0H0_9GLOM|nr:hypothetical protein C1645_841696 [Glomus cerebriforme]
MELPINEKEKTKNIPTYYYKLFLGLFLTEIIFCIIGTVIGTTILILIDDVM